jgi:hypothetical protein
MEKWKAIEDFEAYEVSNLGRVRRRLPARTSKVGKQLNTTFHTNSGYVTLVLRLDGKSCTKNLHRLVAKAFVPNPQNLPQVNHKDGNKNHNAAPNLEWRSNLGNMRHSTQIGIRGSVYQIKNKRWRVRYSPEPNKEVHIGYFGTKEEGRKALDKALASLSYIP